MCRKELGRRRRGECDGESFSFYHTTSLSFKKGKTGSKEKCSADERNWRLSMIVPSLLSPISVMALNTDGGDRRKKKSDAGKRREAEFAKEERKVTRSRQKGGGGGSGRLVFPLSPYAYNKHTLTGSSSAVIPKEAASSYTTTHAIPSVLSPPPTLPLFARKQRTFLLSAKRGRKWGGDRGGARE